MPPLLELEELLELDDELLELLSLPPLELEDEPPPVFPPLLELEELLELDDELLELLGFPPLELEDELPVFPPLLELEELLELDDELLELLSLPPLELEDELLELDELLDELLGNPPELEPSPSGAAASPKSLFSPPPPQAARMARSATAASTMRREILGDGVKRFFMAYSLMFLFGADNRARLPASTVHDTKEAGSQDPSGIPARRIHQRFNYFFENIYHSSPERGKASCTLR
ncbi:MAG: hypothetical protein IPL70_14600 [Uliginosibacterium sp.]|nr:hypothetical protein [Uliginosibacterium sp.]